MRSRWRGAARGAGPARSAALPLLVTAILAVAWAPILTGCDRPPSSEESREPAAVAPAVALDRDGEVEDALLGLQVRGRLLEALQTDALALVVGAERGRVLLSGSVSESTHRARASEVAISVEGVSEVASLIEVTSGEGSSRSPQRQRQFADAVLLTRVRLGLIWGVGADALDLAVDVEDGVVTLRGTVASRTSRERVVAVVREVGGVSRIRDLLSLSA